VDNPLKALQFACARFPDLGTQIPELPPCGEVARFIKFQHAPSILPYEGPESVYHSWSGRAWSEVLSTPQPLRRKLLMERLQGRIRGGEEINVFSTLGQWIDDLGVRGPELSARVRDLLGCPHLDGHALLEVRVAEKAVRATGTFCKPTFADAGGYPPFLASADEDTFGYARDISAPRPGARGGPEVWHGDLPSNRASGLRYLAAPHQRLPQGEWSEFVAYLARCG
jgi:hypothetical protein